MWSNYIMELKAKYFDVFHSDMQQWKKDCILRDLHEKIGQLDKENQYLWIKSGAKAGDIESVKKYWRENK